MRFDFDERGPNENIFLDPWHNYLNMARPFVSLSNMSRPPDIPEFYRRSLRCARSSNHLSHPFLGPVKRREERERERERRGDKGLTYRSVTRYPTRFFSFFFFSSLSLSSFLSCVMHARKNERRHALPCFARGRQSTGL